MKIFDTLMGLFTSNKTRNATEEKTAARIFRQQLASQRSYYESGNWDRLSRDWFPTKQAGDDWDLAAIQRTRDRANWLYGNDAYVNKAVRTIQARIVGFGMTPESSARRPDGTIHEEFRARANELFNRWKGECHSLGNPYSGGMTFDETILLCVKEWIVSGEFLIRFVNLTQSDMEAKGLQVPLQLLPIEAERLYEYHIARPVEGLSIFRGIIFNPDGTRKGYRILRMNPWHVFLSFGAEGWKFDDYPAEEFIHIFIKQRPSTMRGVSMLTPVMLNAKNLDSLIYNEIVASTINSCYSVALTKDPYNTVEGLQPTTTANTGNTDTGSTDSDGNIMSRLQPGMVMRLAPGETVTPIDPERPNPQLDQFATFILRSIATGLPCIKSSTITGDYRQSSFSSEKSNENDCYWEIMQMQEHLINACLRPIYCRFIETALLAGLFDDIPDLPDISEMSPHDLYLLTDSTWRGPTTKSLNPIQDETAVSLAIANGTQNVVDACLEKGVDWKENIAKTAQVYNYAKEQGLPDEFAAQIAFGYKPPLALPDDDGKEPVAKPLQSDK